MKKTIAMFLALLLLVGGCAQNASVESSPEGSSMTEESIVQESSMDSEAGEGLLNEPGELPIVNEATTLSIFRPATENTAGRTIHRRRNWRRKQEFTWTGRSLRPQIT